MRTVPPGAKVICSVCGGCVRCCVPDWAGRNGARAPRLSVKRIDAGLWVIVCIPLLTKDSSMRAQLSSRLADQIQVAACQLLNPAPIAAVDRVFVDQVSADAKRRRTGENEIGRSLLVDASRGDQGHVRKGRFEGPDVAGTAELSAGKDLDEVGAGFGGLHYVRGRQSPGENHDTLVDRELHNFSIEPRTSQEPRTGIQATLRPSKI